VYPTVMEDWAGRPLCTRREGCASAPDLESGGGSHRRTRLWASTARP